MAQRTGAERLLAPLARATSAGAILALVAAALLLGASGCGGGSDEQTTTAAKDTASAPKRAPERGQEPGADSSAEREQKAAARKVDAEGDASDGRGKHGPSISAPKGEQEPVLTPQQKAQSTVANIDLSSAALRPTGSSTSTLPAAYTCDGKDTWPKLSWQGVPSGTAELALLAMNVQPVDEKIFFDWAVAGLDPGLSGLAAGSLPQGAVVGVNSFGRRGYSICPPRGQGETYMFVLYALPESLHPKQGFDPLDLREAAIGRSGNAGLMAASYTRG